MNSSINIESIQPCFNASSSVLAWATSDGRVRLYHTYGQRNVVDITNKLHEGMNDSSAYSCLVWGAKVRCWREEDTDFNA